MKEKEKSDLLAELGKQGFLIYPDNVEGDEVFLLQKVVTPLNPATVIELSDNTFPTYNSALQTAAKIIGWEFEEEVQEVEEPEEYWFFAEVIYNFGLGPRIQNLGTFAAKSPEEKDAKAKELAEKYFEEGEETKKKSWKELQAEVLAKPYNLYGE